MKNYYVYMITNWNNKVLYIGVTNNLERRLYEHKNKLADSFSKKYNLNKLVYYEHGNNIEGAITREKQLKGWLRKKKNMLVESINPEWKDLSDDWYVCHPERTPCHPERSEGSNAAKKDSSPSVQNDKVEEI